MSTLDGVLTNLVSSRDAKEYKIAVERLISNASLPESDRAVVREAMGAIPRPRAGWFWASREALPNILHVEIWAG